MEIKYENEYSLLIRAYESIKSKIPYEPEIGLILGSGLGNFVDNIEVDASINFEDIENFPKATNKVHKGRFVFSKINGKKCIIAQGRVHYYEGYDTTIAVRLVRLMKLIGISILYVTNAAGGINPEFKVGDIMLITDHISLFMSNPLIGKNIDELGIRFPDMSKPYDELLQKKMIEVAERNGIKLVKGVYTQLSGPSFESHAEINALRILGTDAVGMSTVVETIAARHAGIRVLGMSIITNLTAGLTTKEQSNEDVKETALIYGNKLSTLLLEGI